jgi:hypothetical protein
VKETLRRKVKDNEALFFEMVEKKKQAMEEAMNSRKEIVQHEQDVAYLTKETAMLLDDLQTQQKLNHSLRDKLIEQQTDFEQRILEKSRRMQEFENQAQVLKQENDRLV